jgi:hypothetical protein
VRHPAISGALAVSSVLLSVALLTGCQARSTIRGNAPPAPPAECRVTGYDLRPGDVLDCPSAGRLALRSAGRTLESRELDARRAATGDPRSCRIGGIDLAVGTSVECGRDGQFVIHGPGRPAGQPVAPARPAAIASTPAPAMSATPPAARLAHSTPSPAPSLAPGAAVVPGGFLGGLLR